MSSDAKELVAPAKMRVSGTNAQVAEKQALVRKEALEEAIKAASMRPAVNMAKLPELLHKD